MDKKFCKFCGKEIEKDSIVCPKCGRQLMVVKKEETIYSKKSRNNKYNEASKFYTETWFMWIMLIFFAPVGIFLMWKFHPEMKKEIKIILTIVFATLFLAILLGSNGDETTSNSENSSSNSGTNTVNEKKVEVIDFSNMSESEILTWCKEKNLVCDFEREYSDTIAQDKYIKQSVPATEEVPEGSEIVITYSLGKEPTVSQKNAARSAQSYLNSMAFSRSGLIKQLEFEGFSNEDAVYGVEHVSVDWNEQAAKSAKSYLNSMAFSRAGLIEQLEYEGFTREQAVYGVEQNGL